MRHPSHRKTSTWTERLTALRAQAARVGDRAAGLGGRAVATAKAQSMAVSLAAAGVMAAGFVAGTSAAMHSNAAEAEASPVVEASARQLAAERADRSGRTAALPSAAPSAAAAPSSPAATPAAQPAAPAPSWVTPIHSLLSSCYGARWGTIHQGIDFAAPAGTPIVSIGAGTVVAAGWLYTGYGISVVVDHGNGYLSHYAHASQVLVAAGQAVNPGTPLAIEGSTGDSTGPHLHFEIHQGMWNQIDPAPWMRAHGVPIGC